MIVEPCAAVEVREDAVTACVRRPGRHGREQEARVFPAFASCPGVLRDWLAAEGATRVAMDATGVHRRPVWRVLEALEGVELVLVNAHHVRTLPGRRAGVGDACWLAQLLEYELLRGSFVPPCDVARLRSLTRHQEELVEERAPEGRRVPELLDGAGVDEGRLDEHDSCMLRAHLDHLTAAVDRLEEEVLRLTHPFAGHLTR